MGATSDGPTMISETETLHARQKYECESLKKSPAACASMGRKFERGHPRSWLNAGALTTLFVDQCACVRIAGLGLYMLLKFPQK